MKHAISDDFRRLTIFVSPHEQASLRAAMHRPGFHSEDFLHDLLEPLICNTELEWTDASVTGDLTAAPMLAILDEAGQVEHRWGFMDYQLVSVQQRLAETGEAVFIGD